MIYIYFTRRTFNKNKCVLFTSGTSSKKMCVCSRDNRNNTTVSANEHKHFRN